MEVIVYILSGDPFTIRGIFASDQVWIQVSSIAVLAKRWALFIAPEDLESFWKGGVPDLPVTRKVFCLQYGPATQINDGGDEDEQTNASDADSEVAVIVCSYGIPAGSTILLSDVNKNRQLETELIFDLSKETELRKESFTLQHPDPDPTKMSTPIAFAVRNIG